MTKKLLILDGLSELPLARDFYQACLGLDFNATYFDLSKLPKKSFLNLFKKAKKLYLGAISIENYKSKKYREAELVDLIEKEKPTHILVFRYLFKFIEPKTIQVLSKKLGIKVYLYDSDSCNLFPERKEFEYFLDNEVIIYDEIFSFSKVMAEFFTKTINVNASFFPYGSNPILPITEKTKDINVLFVGRSSFRRIFVLEKIKDVVTIYGNRWDKSFSFISKQLNEKIVNKTVWDNDLVDLMQRSKIVINITNSNFYSVETGLNLRIFEALAAGCFLITDYFEELNDLFKVGEELETFSSSEELKSKVDYYLSREAERERIALAGMQKFQKNFTWEKRALAMGKKIGLMK